MINNIVARKNIINDFEEIVTKYGNYESLIKHVALIQTIKALTIHDPYNDLDNLVCISQEIIKKVTLENNKVMEIIDKKINEIIIDMGNIIQKYHFEASLIRQVALVSIIKTLTIIDPYNGLNNLLFVAIDIMNKVLGDQC